MAAEVVFRNVYIDNSAHIAEPSVTHKANVTTGVSMQWPIWFTYVKSLRERPSMSNKLSLGSLHCGKIMPEQYPYR